MRTPEYDTELDIIKRIQHGDINAFEQIVGKYKDRAMTLTVRILKNQEEAEDSLQEAFIKTYKAIADKKFEERSKFSTYFYRIVYNTAIDNYKKLKSRNFNLISTDDSSDSGDSGLEVKIVYDRYSSGLVSGPGKDVSDAEIQNLVNTYLKLLPENYSVILTLFYINDLSHEEISQALNLPLGTVKNRIFRAKEKLKEIILTKYSLETIEELVGS